MCFKAERRVLDLEQHHDLSVIGKREAEEASLRRPEQALYMTVQP